jgi:hypothetical protein
MTQCHPIHFQEINSVSAQLLTLDSIMPGSDTGNKRALQFVLTGPFNHSEFTGDSLGVAMAGVKMAQGHYVSLELAQGITQARVAWVGDNGNFLTLNAKAGMT